MALGIRFLPLAGGHAAYTMAADQGSYALSGQAATFAISMPAGQGSYALTGQTATFGIGMPAAQGSYTLSGQTVTFGVAMPAAQGAYALSGQATTFGITMPAGQGAYVLTGEDATLIYSGSAASLVADQGAYSLTGQDATLIYSGSAVSYTLTADTGFHVLTGQDATLAKSANIVGRDVLTLADLATRQRPRRSRKASLPRQSEAARPGDEWKLGEAWFSKGGFGGTSTPSANTDAAAEAERLAAIARDELAAAQLAAQYQNEAIFLLLAAA